MRHNGRQVTVGTGWERWSEFVWLGPWLGAEYHPIPGFCHHGRSWDWPHCARLFAQSASVAMSTQWEAPLMPSGKGIAGRLFHKLLGIG